MAAIVSSPISLGSLRSRVYNTVNFITQAGSARKNTSSITISEPGTYFITVTTSPGVTGGSNYMGMMQIRKKGTNIRATSISTFLTGSPVMLFASDNNNQYIKSSDIRLSIESSTSFLVGYEGADNYTCSIIINKL